MTLRVLVKRREHDRQDDVDIVADQIAEVLVVPKVKRSLSDLCIIESVDGAIDRRRHNIPGNVG